METRRLFWIGAVAGSTVGGLVPELWGAGILSLAGFLGSTVGALAGIWAAARLVDSL